MAGEINVARYDNNEILHKDDLQYGETRAYENLTSIIERLAVSINDAIIQGGIVKQRGTPSMNVDVESLLSFCVSTGKFAYYGSDFGPVAITNGGAQDRIDTLEVRLKETNFDELQRAYKDPNTGDITYQDWMTKIRYEMEAQVILGTEGAGVAPNHTSGWIKIAEIDVDTGESTSILDADIHNVTAGYDAEVNSGWTAETAVTFKSKALTEIKEILRVKHKEDGDHADDVIQDAHIAWGPGAGEVDADLMPLGTIITHAPTGGTDANLTAASTVRQAVQKILDLLIDLSGVQNDAILDRHINNDQLDSRHYKPASIDGEHVNWGIGVGEVDADLMHIGTGISTTEINIANTVSVRDALNQIAQRVNRPLGTIWLFDGAGWSDNSTIPGWYACIVENAGQGCPDMVDKFVMGKVIAGGGSTGGTNSKTLITANLPVHAHTAGNQSVSHKHDTVMGSHSHSIYNVTSAPDSLKGFFSATSSTGNARDELPGYIVDTDLGTKESGDQKTSHTHTIGDTGSGTAFDNRPAYYSMVYIRKCA